jgi:pyridoxamine 5'-phosphate oxidase
MFQFEDPQQWFFHELDKAIEAQVLEPTAMSLATVDPFGDPQVRVVLYKGWKDSGLVFFSNYKSPKSLDLEKNSRACVNFYWPSLSQQIRIFGSVHRLCVQDSEEYFQSRPRLSQIGAWASDQSSPLSCYQDLEEQVSIFEKKFEGKQIPCPPHWGGFVLTPLKYEFWFGQQGRLHERYLFSRVHPEATSWSKTMLSP